MLTLIDVRDFYDTHEKNTSKVWFNNYFNPVKRLFTDCLAVKSDIIVCLKRYDDVIQQINEKYQTAETVKYYLRALLFLIEGYPGLKDTVKKDKYVIAYDVAKMQAMNDLAEKPVKANVPYNLIKEKVVARYGEYSREMLLVDFYEQVPVRLDLDDIYVYANSSMVATPAPGKYLNLKSKILTMVIYNKTNDKYGDKVIRLSDELILKIRKYLKPEQDVLFIFPMSQGKFIANMLRAAGIDGATMGTLRHSIASKEMTAAERIETARVSGHSAQESLQYRRPDVTSVKMFVPVTLQERVNAMILAENNLV
jgi:hypothetical protein